MALEFMTRLIARFNQIDPMSEAREWLTPYNFVQNNPVNRIHPDGAFDTKAQAKAHAKENDINTGWFSRNKFSKGLTALTPSITERKVPRSQTIRILA
jgi:hypothetical protein